MKKYRLMGLPLAVALVIPPTAYSAGEVQLDLSSSDKNISAQGVIPTGQANVDIKQDGKTVSISAGDMITAAQMVAINQAIGGSQTLTLNAAGAASGGTFAITSNLAHSISGLVVPSGVTAVQDFASSGLNLAGNFSNSGIFYAVSSSNHVATAAIQAANIFNQPGALLTSILPSGGLAGYSNLLSTLNLSLVASGNIVNYGTISSSGSLTATANGTISNLASNGVLPVMQALNDVVMQASNIVNSGNIVSLAGAVNIATANLSNQGLIQSVMQGITIDSRGTGEALRILNNDGLIQSLHQLSLLSDKDVMLTGGQLISPDSISLSACSGSVDVFGSEMGGPVDVAAKNLHMNVHGNLTMNSFNVTDDPLIAVTGDLNLSGQPVTSVSEPLTIVAGGKIDGAGRTLSTTTGDIFVLAGASYTQVDISSPLTITGASGQAGDITNVGDVVTAAGKVFVGTFKGNITTQQLTSNNTGSITVQGPGSITVGNLLSNGGAVSVRTSNPDVVGSSFNSSGTPTATIFALPGTGAGGGDITTGIIDSRGTSVSGVVNLDAGGSVTTQQITTGGGSSLATVGSVIIAARAGTVSTGTIDTFAVGSKHGADVDVIIGSNKAPQLGTIIAGDGTSSGTVKLTGLTSLTLTNPLQVQGADKLLLTSVSGGGGNQLIVGAKVSSTTGDIGASSPLIQFLDLGELWSVTGNVLVNSSGGGSVNLILPASGTGTIKALTGIQITGNTLTIDTSGSLGNLALKTQLATSTADLVATAGDLFIGNVAVSTTNSATLRADLGSIKINGTVNSGNALSVHSNSVRLGDNSALAANTVTIDSPAGLDIILMGASASVLARTGDLRIFPANGTKVAFSSVAPPSQLFLDSSTNLEIGQASGGVVVASQIRLTNNLATTTNVLIKSDNSLINSFTNNGEIKFNNAVLSIESPIIVLGANSLTSASSISVNPLNVDILIVAPSSSTATIQAGNLAVYATSGKALSLSASSASAANLVLSTPAAAFSTDGGVLKIDPSVVIHTSGLLNLLADAGGTLKLDGKITESGGKLGQIFVSAQTLDLGPAASVQGKLIAIGNSTAGTAMQINLASGGNATFDAGSINVNGGGGSIALQLMTGGTSTIKFQGTSSPVTIVGAGVTSAKGANIDSSSDIQIVSSKNIQLSGTVVSSGAIGLATNAAGANIVIANDLTAAKDITISAVADAFITQTAGTMTAGSKYILHLDVQGTGSISQSAGAKAVAGMVELQAGTGSVQFTSSTPKIHLLTSGMVDILNNQNISGAATVYGNVGSGTISNNGDLSIDGLFSNLAVGGMLSVSAKGDVTSTNQTVSNINGTVQISSTAASGSIFLGSDTLGKTVVLTATGSGTIGIATGSAVIANNIYVNAGTGDSILTTQANLQINSTSSGLVDITNVGNGVSLAGTAGNLKFSNSGSLQLGTLTVSGDAKVQMVSGSGLTLFQKVTANNLTLDSTGIVSDASNGKVVTASSLTINASGISLSKVDSPSITLNAAGAVGITETNSSLTVLQGTTGFLSFLSAGSVKIGATGLSGTTASKASSITANGDIDVSGTIIDDNVILSTKTGSNGSILLNAAVGLNPGSVTLTADGAGNIKGAGLITAGQLQMSTKTGDIGTSTGRIQTAIDYLSILSTNNAYVQEQGGLTVLPSQATGTFDLKAADAIQLSGFPSAAITANKVILNTPTDVRVGADVRAVTSIDVTAGTIANVAPISGMFVAPTINLTAASIGGSSSRINVSGPGSTDLTVTATGGSAFIQSNSAVALKASTVGPNLDISSVSKITIVGNVSANLGNGIIDLAVTGSGGITDPFGNTLQANKVNLKTADSSIGAQFVPILTNTAFLTVDSGTGSDVYIKEQDALTLGTSSSAGSFNLTAGGTVDVGKVTAPTIFIVTTAGDILVSQFLSAKTSITLQSAGNIFQQNSGFLSTALAVLSSTGGGDIGSSSKALPTSAATVGANTSGAVYLQDTNDVSLLASTAGGVFQLTGVGDVTVGKLVIAASASFTAKNAMVINVSPIVSSKLSLIGGSITSPVTLSVPSLDLVSTSADIGALGSPLLTSAASATVFSAANVFLSTTGGALSLGKSSVGQDLNLTAAGGIVLTGDVSAGTVNFKAPSVDNNFTITGGKSISMTNAGALSVTGTGKLVSPSTLFTSANGSVSVNQGSVGPIVGGSAATSFSVTSTAGFVGSDITAADITLTSSGPLGASGVIKALTGPLSLVSAAGIAITGAQLTAASNVTVSAVGDVFIGTGTDINAGTISGAFNDHSINISDYNYSAITQPGSIAIKSSGGKIDAATSINLTSRGASISLFAPGDIKIGASSHFLAQGGNITINSLGDVLIGNNTAFAAVSRSIVPSAALTIDGQAINYYSGGDIGINVDTVISNYDNYLFTNFDLNRTALGQTNQVGTVINWGGVSHTVTNGGTIDVRSSSAGGAAKIAAIAFLGSSTMVADGGVIQIDPINSQVIVGPGVSFSAFGPSLATPAVLPVVPAPAPAPAPPPAGGPGGPVVPAPVIPPGGGGAGPGGGSPTGTVTPVDTVTPIATVPVSVSVPPPAVSTDVIVLAEQENENTSRQTAYNTPAIKDFDKYFIPITYVGTAPCQQFLIAGKRRGDLQCITVLASRGTVLGTMKQPEIAPTKKTSFADRVLSLKEGKIVVVSGQKSGLKLDVSNATLNLPVGSVAVVQRKASGAVRVSMVSGGKASVSIKGTDAEQTLTAAPGEEIAFGDSSEELIAADGVERQLISAKMIVTTTADDEGADDMLRGGVEKSGIGVTTASNLKAGKHNLRIEKRSFNRDQMDDGEHLLACLDCAQVGCSSSLCRMRSRQFSRQKARNSAGKQTEKTPEAARPVFSPVAYQISLKAPVAAVPSLSTLQLTSATVKHAGNANIGAVDQNVINASAGEILVAPSKTTVVKAGEATVECSPGSLVLINKNAKSVSVSSLWQEGSVTVHAGSRNYSMRAGEECIVTGKNQTQNALAANAAARRNVRNFNVSASQTICLSEISLASIFLTSPVLQQLRKSTEPVDRAMASRIAKMYAVLNIVTGRRGPYSFSAK